MAPGTPGQGEGAARGLRGESGCTAYLSPESAQEMDTATVTVGSQ